MGSGKAPVIPDEIRVETALRYVTAYELITGETFSARAADASGERQIVERNLGRL